MARGWESKDVENQQDQREERDRLQQQVVKTAEDVAKERLLEDIALRRRRVLKDLRDTSNQRYRLQLEETLRFLDEETSRVVGSESPQPGSSERSRTPQ